MKNKINRALQWGFHVKILCLPFRLSYFVKPVGATNCPQWLGDYVSKASWIHFWCWCFDLSGGGSRTSPGLPDKISQKLDLMIHSGIADLNILKFVTKSPICVFSGDNLPWHVSTVEVVLCPVPSTPVMQDCALTCGYLLLKCLWTCTDPVRCGNLSETDH